ncbi:MAG: hypothetical protein HQ510_13050 [Candidatus Marinimicrobia bacterium]|nr:hypothetical protein [Candidatus Neomarinimicrobiota bacterium]
MKTNKIITSGLLILLLGFFFPQENGDIIESELLGTMTASQVQSQLYSYFGIPFPDAIYDISVYRVVYQTEFPDGESILASGTITIPQNDEFAFPVVSAQHGTETVRNNVSSVYGFDAINMWLGAYGYITLEPDYIGLGVSQLLHPYHMATPSSESIIHMIRASRYFCDDRNDIQYNNQLFLLGYSEGGYTTMAAHKSIEENYADEFNVTMSIPMAGAYSLSGVMVDMMLSGVTYSQPYYVAYIMLAYIQYYEDGNFQDYFTNYYTSLLPGLFDGTHPGWQINSYLPSIPINILQPSVIDEFSQNDQHPLRLALQNNDLYDWTPQASVYLIHGMGDEVVPYENSQLAYEIFLANGADDVHLIGLPASLGGHGPVSVYCLLQASTILQNHSATNIHGDVNGDLAINVLDIVQMVAIILGTHLPTSYESWAADVNWDGTVNVLDVVNILGPILEP